MTFVTYTGSQKWKLQLYTVVHFICDENKQVENTTIIALCCLKRQWKIAIAMEQLKNNYKRKKEITGLVRDQITFPVPSHPRKSVLLEYSTRKIIYRQLMIIETCGHKKTIKEEEKL